MKATAYDKMAGRYTEVIPEQSKQEATEMLTQQHNEWLNIPETVQLLKFLQEREIELCFRARGLVDSNNINRLLSKSAAIKEVIEYVRTGSNSIGE